MNSSPPSQLHIDPEFQSLIPPLSTEERDGLEQSILAEGVRDPVVVWNTTIVDGHNRYKIASGQNGNGEILDCPTVYRDFPNKRAAKLWIIENQMEQRRNLRDRQRIKLAEAKREIIEASTPVGRPLKGDKETTQNFVEFPNRSERETNAQLGEMAQVSREQIRKNNAVEEWLRP